MLVLCRNSFREHTRTLVNIFGLLLPLMASAFSSEAKPFKFHFFSGG
jgi:hypothetical protein